MFKESKNSMSITSFRSSCIQLTRSRSSCDGRKQRFSGLSDSVSNPLQHRNISFVASTCLSMPLGCHKNSATRCISGLWSPKMPVEQIHLCLKWPRIIRNACTSLLMARSERAASQPALCAGARVFHGSKCHTQDGSLKGLPSR